MTARSPGDGVGRLCLGTLPMASFHNDMQLEQGADLIRYALDRGIRSFDTAQLYGTYEILREGLHGFRQPVQISTKTHASTRVAAAEHIDLAMEQLQRIRLDTVYIHAPKITEPLEARREVLEHLVSLRRAGVVREVGLATHRVDAVYQASREPELDVVLALINRAGIGIIDGSASDMLEAIREASRKQKRVVAVKALGGGNLIEEAETALDYVLGEPSIDSVAIGMTSREEIDLNVALFQGEPIATSQWRQVTGQRRRLRVLRFCNGCGSCVEACGTGALTVVDGQARVDDSLCTLCGYCAVECPSFVIRVA